MLSPTMTEFVTEDEDLIEGKHIGRMDGGVYQRSMMGRYEKLWGFEI